VSCITFIEVRPRYAGYHFELLSSCARDVQVDIDDCEQDPDMQVQCKESTVRVGRNSTYAGLNYRKLLNTRFR
jgi:hypothetical protein